jgi:hypothetical protein
MTEIPFDNAFRIRQLIVDTASFSDNSLPVNASRMGEKDYGRYF